MCFTVYSLPCRVTNTKQKVSETGEKNYIKTEKEEKKKKADEEFEHLQFSLEFLKHVCL